MKSRNIIESSKTWNKDQFYILIWQCFICVSLWVISTTLKFKRWITGNFYYTFFNHRNKKLVRVKLYSVTTQSPWCQLNRPRPQKAFWLILFYGLNCNMGIWNEKLNVWPLMYIKWTKQFSLKWGISVIWTTIQDQWLHKFGD